MCYTYSLEGYQMLRGASLTALRRQQIDGLVGSVPPNAGIRPKTGWIREIRAALGMTSGQLARRMGVRQSTVAKLELSEQAATISLGSLQRAAEALDCSLVYLLVPRDSLDRIVHERASTKAAALVNSVSHSMSLESQSVDAEQLNATTAEIAAEIVRAMPRDLWDDPA